ncbi:MAG TPA: hypothetical protein VGP41_08545, partial [Candidatus Lustribacter sp.]|nr:hypothetical protein [Candidatus Lustribacter sp.]
ASGSASLDAAGAFTAELALPPSAPAGDAVILASTEGASAGATIHIDGVGDSVLSIVAPCSTACSPAAPIPLTLLAKRAGVPVANADIRVRIVRSPHVQPPDAGDDAAAWGVTTIVDTLLHTDPLGVAHVAIPAPTDGLASTYGVVAASGAATASANLVAPNARIALAVKPLAASIDPSDPATFDVRGFDALDGEPAVGQTVSVQISHGPQVQNDNVTLGADGSARVTFHDVALGMNLLTAQADVDGHSAIDVAAITVEPRALSAESTTGDNDVKIAVDPARQKPGEHAGVTANLSGAVGDALITMEGVRGVTPAVVPATNGAATTSLTVPETIGALAIGAAFVRDGALVDATQPLVVDGPGHQRQLALSTDRAAYAPGTTAHVTIADGDDRSAGTLAVRVSDRRGTGGASFDDIPGVLASAGTTTQNLASNDPPWHTWVAPAKSTAGDIFGFDQPRQGAAPDTIAAAATHVFSWSVQRATSSTFDVTVPHDAGRYVLSVIKMTDDGDVGAASIALTVQ